VLKSVETPWAMGRCRISGTEPTEGSWSKPKSKSLKGKGRLKSAKFLNHGKAPKACPSAGAGERGVLGKRMGRLEGGISSGYILSVNPSAPAKNGQICSKDASKMRQESVSHPSGTGAGFADLRVDQKLLYLLCDGCDITHCLMTR